MFHTQKQPTMCKFVINQWGASNPHKGLFTLIVAAVKALLVVEYTQLSRDKAEKRVLLGVADGTVKTISLGQATVVCIRLSQVSMKT